MLVIYHFVLLVYPIKSILILNKWFAIFLTTETFFVTLVRVLFYIEFLVIRTERAYILPKWQPYYQSSKLKQNTK